MAKDARLMSSEQATSNSGLVERGLIAAEGSMYLMLFEADPLGSGARSCGYRREVVYSDMTDWRRFGRASGFSERRMKDVIA
jgi:hypothetical protein